MGSTFIRRGVKLDNLVQVAHNVEIGPDSVVAAQAGISGSAVLGARCSLGGQVGITGHLQIANGTRIGGQSGVMRSISKENQDFLGSPVQELKDHLRSAAVYRKLPDLQRRLEKLEEKMIALLHSQNH